MILKFVMCPSSDGINKTTNEPPHDKTNEMAGVLSKDSDQCTQWVAKDPSLLHVDSENSDQTGQMPRLSLRWVHRPYCWFCHERAH